jgi:hypothetical protein
MEKAGMVEAMRASDSDRWPPPSRDAERRLTSLYERGFSAEVPSTVGLEEELILVDADSLLPLDAVESVLAWLGGDDRFKPEFRASRSSFARASA